MYHGDVNLGVIFFFFFFKQVNKIESDRRLFMNTSKPYTLKAYIFCRVIPAQTRKFRVEQPVNMITIYM